jgi:hypothetical protein
MGFGGGTFGGAGNAGMHLGGRDALGGTGSLGVGGLGLRGPALQGSPPSGAVPLVSPEVARFDARMGLEPGRVGDTFEQFAPDRTSKANGKSANVKHDRILSAAEIEEQELELEQSQQLSTTASPLTATSLSELTTSEIPPPVPAETIQTTPDTVTSPLSESGIGTINAYFAGHAAAVPSVPTSSVNVSIGGAVPSSVALFPLPIDLLNQLPDGNFAYFFWGNNVVIADSQTNVVDAIIPNVLSAAPLED